MIDRLMDGLTTEFVELRAHWIRIFCTVANNCTATVESNLVLCICDLEKQM